MIACLLCKICHFKNTNNCDISIRTSLDFASTAKFLSELRMKLLSG